MLRIPAWAAEAHIEVNGAPVNGIKPGEFARVERAWKNGDHVNITFPARVRLSEGYHNSAIVERGALVYSLAIGESWHKFKQTGPASDWEVFPTTPWNYCLDIAWEHAENSFRVEEKPVGKQPFSFDGAPVILFAHGQRLAEWEIQDSSAGTLPVSPVSSKMPEEEIRLIPYGAAKLRITNFPWSRGVS
jgi:hypothetical protein